MISLLALKAAYMGLKRGKSRAVIQYNTRKLIREGRSPEQAAAISYRKAGLYRKGIHRRRGMRKSKR